MYCPGSQRSSAEILEVDAEHPGERPAGEPDDALHALIHTRAPRHIQSVIGNTAAYAVRGEDGEPPRFIKFNLMLADAKPTGSPEERRKFELVTREFPGRKLILSRHGAKAYDADYAFCSPSANSEARNAIRLFGMTRVVYPPMPHYALMFPQYLGVDLSLDSKLTAEILYQKLVDIRDGAVSRVDSVRHCYAMIGSITTEVAMQYDLPEDLEPFCPLGAKNAERLGLPSNAIGTVPCWDPAYYREICVPLD